MNEYNLDNGRNSTEFGCVHETSMLFEQVRNAHVRKFERKKLPASSVTMNAAKRKSSDEQTDSDLNNKKLQADDSLRFKRMAPSFLSPRQLGLLMESKPSCVQLVDCRSFLHYNSNRIVGSVNIFCPPLVKKRFSHSVFPLSSLLSAEAKATLVRGGVDVVVLYDDDTDEQSWQTSLRCDLQIVLDSLMVFLKPGPVTYHVLAGGYSRFQRECAHLCSSHNTLSAQLKAVSEGCLRLPVTTTETTQTHSSTAHSDFHLPMSPVELLPYLYLGDSRHSSKKELLQELRITAILNVSTRCSNHFPCSFRYSVIPVEDTNSADLAAWFSTAFRFIDQEKQRGGKVLVHCRGGISRSATVCLAYLMYSRALRLEDAFDYVRARRHVVSPNANFMLQLMQFEAELRSLGFDRSCLPLQPTLSPCRLESHSKSVFDLSSADAESDTARSPTEVTPTLSRVSLVS